LRDASLLGQGSASTSKEESRVLHFVGLKWLTGSLNRVSKLIATDSTWRLTMKVV